MELSPSLFDDRPHFSSLAELNATIAASSSLTGLPAKAVLGEGPVGAAIAFVGEQPGDREDIEGRPFVGPAGQILNAALTEAGIDRTSTYVTNAVKHFKYLQQGKRRLHQSPTSGDIKHYRWWLLSELDFVAPRIVVALGATASHAMVGKAVSITKMRGKTQFGSFPGYITVHPSYLLRLPDETARAQAYQDFVRDLEIVRALAS